MTNVLDDLLEADPRRYGLGRLVLKIKETIIVEGGETIDEAINRAWREGIITIERPTTGDSGGG